MSWAAQPSFFMNFEKSKILNIQATPVPAGAALAIKATRNLKLLQAALTVGMLKDEGFAKAVRKAAKQHRKADTERKQALLERDAAHLVAEHVNPRDSGSVMHKMEQRPDMLNDILDFTVSAGLSFDIPDEVIVDSIQSQGASQQTLDLLRQKLRERRAKPSEPSGDANGMSDGPTDHPHPVTDAAPGSCEPESRDETNADPAKRMADADTPEK